jgi:hypothetical protein
MRRGREVVMAETYCDEKEAERRKQRAGGRKQ